MFINEVEEIVGLSKKSIRYYEENRLLSPKRDKDNGYRIYNDNDIRKLKIIKFLRELNISVSELKLLDSGEISLEQCMLERVKKIEIEEEKYQKIKNMCIEIINSKDSYDNIDIVKYFNEINILNKEGFTLRDVESCKKRKIIGSIISSIVFISFFVLTICLLSYLQITDTEKMPWALYWFSIAIFVFPILGIIYNLVIRIKEINGGEEDEASKY